MKKQCALITALFLGSCASTQNYTPRDHPLSNEKHQQLIQLIKKQKGITEEPLEQIVQNEEATLDSVKPLLKLQTQPADQSRKNTPETPTILQVQPANNIYDFLSQNYGLETFAQLLDSSKSGEILTRLEEIHNYQEIIPLLYEDLSLQIERTYCGGMKDKKPSPAERLTFLSLIPRVQNNPRFTELLKKLSSLGVNLEFTESQAFLIPDAFYRIEDWQNQPNSRTPEIHFSGEEIIQLILERPDVPEFLDNPESLDRKLESWARSASHNLQSAGEGFDDGSESEFNYANLDFLQKLEQYLFMFSLNWGNLKEEITELIVLDLSKNYTEEGGVIYVGDDGHLHLKHIESAAKEILPEPCPLPDRLAYLAESLESEELFVLIGGLSRELTADQATRLTPAQIISLTKRVAEIKNAKQNHHYSIDNFNLKLKENVIGMFHIHATQLNEHGNAGPSAFIFQNPINETNGGLNVGDSDLTNAITILEYNGKHALNLVFTSVNKKIFDVNLYYASGKEGSHTNNNTVNVSLGLYNRTPTHQQR